MKKIFYFVIAWGAASISQLWSSSTLAQYETFYGVSSYSSTTRSVRILTTIGIILLVPAMIAILIKKFRKVKFNYKSDYKKFKPNDKVKITFIDENGKIVTKCCHITSISDKKIIFENKTDVYECAPSDIKNIQKWNRKIFILLITVIILATTSLLSTLYNYYSYKSNLSAYGVYMDDDWED